MNPKKYKSNSLWIDSWKRLKRNKPAVLSGWYIIFVCFVSVFAVQIAPYSFETQNIDRALLGPNSINLLGTDSLGRDLFSRIIYGARISMAVAILTAVISLAIGLIYGMVSGWIGGKTDALMMRFVDILYSIPTLVLLILVMVIFDAIDIFENPELKAVTGVLLALSLVGWTTIARLVRGQVLQTKEMLYVEAAKALGQGDINILLKHVLPNILGPIIITLTFQIPLNVLFESFLSFIGLGLQPPFSSWGVLCSDGWRSLKSFPHLILFPGGALFLTMLAFNLFGDGLRDAFDPKA